MSDNDRSGQYYHPPGINDAERPPKLRERAAVRLRVLKSGIIAFNGRHSTMPCTVRNISATGVRLRSETVDTIPDTFELFIELDGLEAECAVTWRNGRDVGAKFLSTPKHVAPKRKQVVAAVGPPSLRRRR